MRQSYEFWAPQNTKYFGTLDLTQEGYWVIREDAHHAQWVREHGDINHDPDFVKWCADWIRPDSVVIDVGANIGTHSVPYLMREPGTLYVFEPIPDAFECLRRNLLRAAAWLTGTREIIGRCMAIGKEAGTTEIGADPFRPGCASILERSNSVAILDGIPINCLDSIIYLPNQERVSLLKIDVEGYEPDVIFGGMGLLGRGRPTIILEVNQHRLKQNAWDMFQLFDLLRSVNYKPAGRWPPKFDSLDFKALSQEPQFDICWIPES